MPNTHAEHIRHHGRFYMALVIGAAVAGALIGFDPGPRIAIGGNAFFASYLVSTAWVARRFAVADLRKKASFEDEGIALIALITLAAIALSLGSLALLLGEDRGSAWHLLPAVANVPLGWGTLHTVMAFHYAHLFYSKTDDPAEKGRKKDSGGLDFPETKEPGISDFIYYSFVIGMTAQVSDVEVTSPRMRHLTTMHGVVSFFFNTIILAFTVNVLTH